MDNDHKALVGLLVVGLFFQGIYFNNLLMIVLVSGLLLLLRYVVHNKVLKIPKDLAFYFFLLLFMLNLLGYITAMEKGMIVYDVFRSLFYIVIYLLIYQMYEEKFIEKLKIIWCLSVMVSGIISTLSYSFGLFSRLEYVINNRLSGPLQYANTYGVVLLAALIAFITIETKTWQKIAGIIALLVPLILTMSRSTFLIAVFVIIILFIKERPDKATYIGLIVSIVSGTLIIKINDITETFQRIIETNLNVSEWQTRLLYYQDALTMIKERPLGYGTYGYYYIQKTFQTGSTYNVRYVHSSLLQITLDIGIIGALLFILFGVYVIFLRRYEFSKRMVVLVLLGHSLIDIDLQFSYVWVMMILFLIKDYSANEIKLTNKRLYIPIISGIIMISIYFTVVANYYHDEEYEKALKLYPMHTEAMRRTFDYKNIDEDMVKRAKKLIESNKYISSVYRILKYDAINEKRYDEAVEYSKAMLDANVLNISQYEQYSNTLLLAAEQHILNGSNEQAMYYLDIIENMPRTLEKLAKEKNTLYNVKHRPMLEMTENLVKDNEIAKAWAILVRK